MKKTIALFLVVSLSANAWLLLRPSPPVPAAAIATRARPSPANAASSDNAALVRALAHVDPTEPDALVQSLRAAGASDETTRATLDGVLRQNYRAAVSAWRIERFRNAWWKGAGRGNAGMPVLRTLVSDPAKKILGPDPLDIADAAVRYDFLPPEKRRLLALIDLDYAELLKPGSGTFGRAATKAEATEEQLLVQERRKDVLAALSPAERTEYDLRFSGTAVLNAERFAHLNVTESEFRTLKPLLDEYQSAFRAAMVQSNYGPEAIAVEQRTVDQIVGALGYDRALEYLWHVSGAYDDVVAVMRDLNQPARVAARVFQLGAETGERAAAIHYDPSLTAEQKKAALLTLQESVRPQLDALVPPAAQTRLPEPAIGWFQLLGEGRYEQMRPTLYGNGRGSVPPVSVTSPTSRPARPMPLARPSGR
jgi:hypothetical protein